MIKTCALGIMLAVGAAVAPAQAQLFNEPYQFNRGGSGGPGMSFGYREAIIDEHLTGSRPEFFVRGPAGNLLDVEDAGNGLAIVRTRGSTVLPGATVRGGRSLGLSVHLGTSAGGTGFIPDPAASITTWTAMASGLPAPPQRWILRGHQPAPIDAWVMQAEALRYGLAQPAPAQ